MRDLTVIGNKIIEIVEKHYDKYNKEQFIYEMKSIIESSLYSPPEMMPVRWNMFTMALNTYLLPMDSEWKEQIGKLFANEISIKDLEGEI